MSSEPTTLAEAIFRFSDPNAALATMVALRWPNGVTCPACGRTDPGFIATRRIWECKQVHVRKQFTAKRGTIFEDSPLGLDKWLTAFWMIANGPGRISSHEMHRVIGITQKSAWFMANRIQRAMETESFANRSDDADPARNFIGRVAQTMLRSRRPMIVSRPDGTDPVITADMPPPKGSDSGHPEGAIPPNAAEIPSTPMRKFEILAKRLIDVPRSELTEREHVQRAAIRHPVHDPSPGAQDGGNA